MHHASSSSSSSSSSCIIIIIVMNHQQHHHHRRHRRRHDHHHHHHHHHQSSSSPSLLSSSSHRTRGPNFLQRRTSLQTEPLPRNQPLQTQPLHLLFASLFFVVASLPSQLCLSSASRCRPSRSRGTMNFRGKETPRGPRTLTQNTKIFPTHQPH